MTEYKGSGFSELINNGKPVLVKFYADWCGPCKMLSPVIEELSSERSDADFLSVNIDDYRDIAVRNNVRGVPTVIIFKDGKETVRKTGFVPKDVLSSLLNLVK